MLVGTRLSLFALAGLVAGAVTSSARPASADTQAVLGGPRLAAVKRLPVPVYLPAQLPPGLHLTNFEIHDPRKPDNHSGWGYEIQAKGAHTRLLISEATYEFGADESDYKGFRRPFSVNSPLFGLVRFEPDTSDDEGWCYSASLAVPGATQPPQKGHSRPVLDFVACGMEQAAVEQTFRTMRLVKAQTPYPKS